MSEIRSLNQYIIEEERKRADVDERWRMAEIYPPKAEVRGSNPFGRANDFNWLHTSPGRSRRPGKQGVSAWVEVASLPRTSDRQQSRCCGHAAIIGDVLKAFLLLVTWFTPGQPTTNYQTAFSSSESCEVARLQVIKDAERAKQELFDRYRQANMPPMMAAAGAPSVSAVCVAQ